MLKQRGRTEPAAPSEEAVKLIVIETVMRNFDAGLHNAGETVALIRKAMK
jgi:hypothetical protein